MIFKNKLNTAIEEYRNRHHILYEYNLNQDIDQAETKAVYTVSKDGMLEMKYTPKFSLFKYPFFNFISGKCEKLEQDNHICYSVMLEEEKMAGQMFCFASEYSFQSGDVLIYHKNVEHNVEHNVSPEHRLTITIGNEETVQSYQQSFSSTGQAEEKNNGTEQVLYQLKPKESAAFWQYTEDMKQGDAQLVHWRQDACAEEQNIEKMLVNGTESQSIVFYKADEAVEIQNERFRRPFDALQQSDHVIIQGICEGNSTSGQFSHNQMPEILDRDVFQIGQDHGWIYLYPVMIESNVKKDFVIIGNGQYEVEVYDAAQKQWRESSELSRMGQPHQETFSEAENENGQSEIRLRIHMKAFSKIAKIMIALREE